MKKLIVILITTEYKFLFIGFLVGLIIGYIIILLPTMGFAISLDDGDEMLFEDSSWNCSGASPCELYSSNSNVFNTTWEQTGSWDNSGWAKFTLIQTHSDPQEDVGFSGIGIAGSHTSIFVAWAVKFGPDWHRAMGYGDSEWKWGLIYDTTPAGNESKIGQWVCRVSGDPDYQEAQAFYICNAAGGNCWDEHGRHQNQDPYSCNRAGYTYTFRSDDSQGNDQWYYMVWEVNIGGTDRLYVASQDGTLTLDNVYASVSNQMDGPYFDYFRLLAYWEGGTAGSDRWIGIDNIGVFHTKPSVPTGFLTADTGLPFEDDFETGDFSLWNGSAQTETGSTRDVSTDGVPYAGTYHARSQHREVSTYNDNYIEHRFGDYHSIGKDKVEEIWWEGYSKFSSGYGDPGGTDWPDDNVKVMLLNITDGVVSTRRYQVMVQARKHSGESSAEYRIQTADWNGTGLGYQAWRTAPQTFISPGTYDKIKLYAKMNVGNTDNGILRLWINGNLLIEDTSVNIRAGTSFGFNKLILSSYTTSDSLENGWQYYDNWYLGESDPATGDTTPPVINNPLPSTQLFCQTNPNSVTLQVTTDENATCKFDTSDTTYDLMTYTFYSTGSTEHSNNTNLACSNSYTYYTRCMDVDSNKNSTSTEINFSIAGEMSGHGTGGGGASQF